MKCEFELCVYNQDAACIVDEPTINSIGMCETCIKVTFDSDFLQKEKERQLHEITRR